MQLGVYRSGIARRRGVRVGGEGETTPGAGTPVSIHVAKPSFNQRSSHLFDGAEMGYSVRRKGGRPTYEKDGQWRVVHPISRGGREPQVDSYIPKWGLG
jgi:hypothetical protein